jgi:hypothetical protein
MDGGRRNIACGCEEPAQHADELRCGVLGRHVAQHGDAEAKTVERGKDQPDHGRRIEIARNVAARLRVGDGLNEPILHLHAIATDLRRERPVTHALGEDVGDQGRILVREFPKPFNGEHPKCVDQIRARGEHLEEGIHLGMLFRRDRCDDVALGSEVPVERAGRDPRLGADLLHRRLVEAATPEADKRRLENFAPPPGGQFGIGNSGHRTGMGVDGGWCAAYKANVRSLNANALLVKRFSRSVRVARRNGETEGSHPAVRSGLGAGA